MDTKELVTDTLRPPRGQRRAQRQRPASGRWTTGCTPPEADHATCGSRTASSKCAQTLSRGAVGRHAGRRRPHLPQHELSRRCTWTSCRRRISCATRALDPHPRQLRIAARRRQRGQHRLAGAAQPRRQPRRIRTASLRPDGRSPPSRRSARRPIYRGDRLPAELYGNVFVAEPAGNLVSRIVVTDDGTMLRGAEGLRARRVPRLDRRAVPAGLSVHRSRRHAVHRRHVSRHHPAQGLHHRVPARSDLSRKLEQPTGHGRIYRVVHDTTKRGTEAGAGQADAGRSSSSVLSHPNGWWRDMAQRLLVERGDRSVVPAA